MAHMETSISQPIRVPRYEELRIPGRPAGRRPPAPIPLRPLRQAPAPPVKNATIFLVANTDDSRPRSPEIVDIDHGKENPSLQAFDKRQRDSRRLTDHSEKSFDILQYYLTAANASPSVTPEPDGASQIAIAAFDFEFQHYSANRQQVSGVRPFTTNNVTQRDILAVKGDMPQITTAPKTTTPNHKKAYSLFPTIQPPPMIEAVRKTSIEPRLSTHFTTTPKRPRRGTSPALGIHTGPAVARANSSIVPDSAGKLPSRPLTVRVRSSTSSSGAPTTVPNFTSSRGSSSTGPTRWSEDTMSPSATSPSIYSRPTSSRASSNLNSMSTRWTGSTARDSFEPLYPVMSHNGEPLVSCFEDDDDDEERPLRWRWKRPSMERKARRSVLTKSWSPQSSIDSTTIRFIDGYTDKRKQGWRHMLCGCLDVD